MPIEFNRIVPTLRIFDVEKAKEFYVGWLGCKVDWEHQFEANTPWYMQVSRGNLVLHPLRASRRFNARVGGVRGYEGNRGISS